ncbi:Pycsar system effector family protein [Qipengyuania nanhaisediminis]|uniref:Pycsar system effector family protein n=1 Tax=Qipengyuania nanhaisediminis TaxID=604088 RepID=UPI0038B2EAA9
MAQDSPDSLVVQTGQSPGDRAFSAQAVHLARTAQINTLTLSQMADQKASILIGATFVVFSLAVTRLIGSDIHASTLCLAATAFLSSLFAVLAVIPSLGKPPSDPALRNPLFFGHFADEPAEEWAATMLATFESDEALLRAMLTDIHQNGQVLYRRKYRFLGYAYRIFLGGLAVTIAVYCAEAMALI